DVENISERIGHLSKLAEMLLSLEGEHYVERLDERTDPVFRSVAAMIGADAAMKEGRRDEAEHLASRASAFGQEPAAKPHTPYLLAWILEKAAASGLASLDPQ